eukprot:PhF_6_TR21163/c0_g1_i4/m.30487
MTVSVLWIMISLFGLAQAGCSRCYGSGCGVCGTEVIDSSPYCSNHGKSTRILYSHDTCGGCSQNNGPYQCTCYEGYEPASQDAGSTPGCSRCSANYDNSGTASNPVCVKACAMQPMRDPNRLSQVASHGYNALTGTFCDFAMANYVPTSDGFPSGSEVKSSSKRKSIFQSYSTENEKYKIIEGKFQLTGFEIGWKSFGLTFEKTPDQKVLIGYTQQAKTIEYVYALSYEVNLPDKIPVLPTFQDDFAQDYKVAISKYGTHYVKGIDVGGE